jgi:hypothetical protein
MEVEQRRITASILLELCLRFQEIEPKSGHRPNDVVALRPDPSLRSLEIKEDPLGRNLPRLENRILQGRKKLVNPENAGVPRFSDLTPVKKS